MEAGQWHDRLSNYTQQQVLATTQDGLRASITRWQTLARERLQDFYLVMPKTKLEPKQLMKGAQGCLTEEHLSLLRPIEVSDLNEACYCLVVGSATATEHIALRAAENLLRRWYKHKTGNTLRRGTWGTILRKLAQEYPEDARPAEIALLGYLKLRRDEVAHPDRMSNLADAEVTLMNVCSLIRGIASVLAVADQSNGSMQQHEHIA